MKIKLSPDPMPEQGVFTRSDHYLFVKQGVPAVFLVTGLRERRRESLGRIPGGRITAPSDDMAQKIDWEAGATFRRGQLPDHAGDGGLPIRHRNGTRRRFLRRYLCAEGTRDADNS